MTIEDKSGFSDWQTYEHKPQPAPADIQAKQFSTEFVWKCPQSGAIINGSAGDYLIQAGQSCHLIKGIDFEKTWQLKT